jgi:hypothetical protein
MNEQRICLIGDGHMARWGSECPELRTSLRRQYSQTHFEFENQATPSSRVGSALWRVSNDSWDGASWRRGASAFDPTLTIVESFAYAHRCDGPEGMGEYRDLLRRLVDELRQTTGTKVIFCLTVPPHRERFLENSPEYAHTSRAARQRFADDVRLYLDEARRIAQDEEWPLADVASEVEKRVAAGENPRRFTDQGDSLHPSRYGFEVQASVLVRAIDMNRMVDEPVAH